MAQEPKPYGIADKVQQEGQWSVAFFEVRENPPIEFGLIAGDFINNVNAALDHLVYGLSATKRKGTSTCLRAGTRRSRTATDCSME